MLVDKITLETIRNNLINAFRESGHTQTYVARKLGVAQQTVNQYVSGRAMPALDTFANLCVILDADPAEILGIKDQLEIKLK